MVMEGIIRLSHWEIHFYHSKVNRTSCPHESVGATHKVSVEPLTHKSFNLKLLCHFVYLHRKLLSNYDCRLGR